MQQVLDLIWAAEFFQGKRIGERMYRATTGLLEIDAGDDEILDMLIRLFGGFYRPNIDQVEDFLQAFSQYDDPYYKALTMRRTCPELWEVADMCNGDLAVLIEHLTPSLSESTVTRLSNAYAMVRAMQHNGPIYA